MRVTLSPTRSGPPTVCADGARLQERLWVLSNPNDTLRVSCGLYMTGPDDLALKLWRNGSAHREQQGDEATLREVAEAHRRELEAWGWTVR